MAIFSTTIMRRELLFLLLVTVTVLSSPEEGTDDYASSMSGPLLHYNFPSEADTLAYVDALKHSDLSEWRSLEEVAARAGGGSCSGAVTTSVLTALYLLGLFNLCAASPVSCCIPPVTTRRRRRKRSVSDPTTHYDKVPSLKPLLHGLRQNLSSLSMKQFRDLPHVSTPDGGRVPVHVSVVEQVRKLWDSNPRLLSSVTCTSATESVRSSFISLSGVASGIILAYSVAQLSQCYPDVSNSGGKPPKIWFFDIPKPPPNYSPPKKEYPIPSLPGTIPVPGDSEDEDGCDRNEVPLEGGRCAPLLSPTHCPYHHWVLLNRDTMKGECVPRLCGDGRVFVEKDEMCHHVDETGLCPRNQRLYVTATGHAVCDCPDGMFQGPYGHCYHLYERAYCSNNQVLMFNKEQQSLSCQPDPCGHVNANLWQDDLPYAPSNDGFCYQFNADEPCGKGKRFGFDTEELEAECVSLVDAGLVRPRRSYMYHHMSFPSNHDEKFPHYQVSYVILNGTTWGLEIKGVGDEKKNSTSRTKRSSEQKVNFIDTRDIPKKLEDIIKPKYNSKLRRNYKLRGRKRKKQAGSKSPHTFNQHKQNIEQREYGYFQSKVSVVQNNLKQSNKKHDSLDSQSTTSVNSQAVQNKYLDSLKTSKDKTLSQSMNAKTSMQKTKNLKSESSTENVSNKEAENRPTKQILSAEKTVTKQILKKAGDKASEPIVVKQGKHKSSIDVGTSKQNKTVITDGHKKDDKLNNTVESRVQAMNNMSELIKQTNGTKPDVRTTLTKQEHQKILREAIKEEMERIIQKKELRNTVRKAIQSQIKENDNNTTEGIVVVDQSLKNIQDKKSPPSLQNIVKVNQKQTSQVPTNVAKSKSSIKRISTKKTKLSVSHKPRKRTGKELRRGKRRKYHRKRGRRKKKKGQKIGKYNHQRKYKKKKRKNPSLPVKIATTTTAPPTTTTTQSTKIKNNQKLVIKQKSSKKQTSTSENKVPSPKKVSHSSEDLHSSASETSEAELSLPDYLRHRGRRQLGGGGGIIQAPLLSACKPGAKRDYNYKCRAKFIPQERNRRDSEDSSDNKETTPSTPRIKCPKGTRLNPRGQCQASSSILG